MAAHLLDPELAAAIGPFKAEDPAYTPTVEEARVYFDKAVTTPFKTYMEPFLPPEATYVVRDEQISVDGGEITVRCLVPVVEDDIETFPVLFNIHGGGFTGGSIELDDYFLRRLCVDLRLSIVNVEYRLAPEYPFPIGVNDCLAALKWTVLNASLLRADLTKGFIVGGHSAGANLAVVMAHETTIDPFFSATPGRQLTGQLIREPRVLHPDAIPGELKAEMTASVENRYFPPLTGAISEHLLKCYAPVPTDPRCSPLLYPSHAAVSPAFVQGMQRDALRDDARVYARALRGARVTSSKCLSCLTSVAAESPRLPLYADLGMEPRVRYLGVTHGFHYNWPALKASVKLREDVVEGLKWLLGRENGLDGKALNETA
ncbi:Alpha/Beta hydrolase protein [Trametes polyzona]|nr:Alpha/Beta hydrolase protein [Trametes polyzona]